MAHVLGCVCCEGRNNGARGVCTLESRWRTVWRQGFYKKFAGRRVSLLLACIRRIACVRPLDGGGFGLSGTRCAVASLSRRGRNRTRGCRSDDHPGRRRRRRMECRWRTYESMPPCARINKIYWQGHLSWWRSFGRCRRRSGLLVFPSWTPHSVWRSRGGQGVESIGGNEEKRRKTMPQKRTRGPL